ncbi:hypothetical protein MPER_08388, partial [Moniliophthora perniciosa FA553]
HKGPAPRGDTRFGSVMASSEFSLQFIFSQASNADLRTFKIVKIPEESGPSIELYRVGRILITLKLLIIHSIIRLQFHHPVTGLHIGTTTFQRLNLLTNVYETAGQIGWVSNHNATIVFGVEEVNMKELRKAKKANSKSQRFKAGNSEYKWKRVDNDIKKDLVCVDSRGKTVVTWTHDSSMLVVSRKVEAHLDRVVVTCFLNIWAIHMSNCHGEVSDRLVTNS